MSRPRTTRAGALALLLAACAPASTGCIHNHYYTPGGVPAYTTTDIGPVTIGSVCEVPPSRVVGGTVVTQGPPAAASPDATATATAPAPRVLLSQPATGPRLSWRRPDPEGSLATTRVDGAMDATVDR